MLARLEQHSHKVYLAGSCVRELITSTGAIDFDLVTCANIEQIRYIFRDCQINEHQGGVTVFSGTMAVFIKPFYNGNLLDDLGNRDFTFNAIAYNPTEGVIDPFHGLNCLNITSPKVIKAINENVFIRNPLSILDALGICSADGPGADYSYEVAVQTKKWLFNNAHRLSECQYIRNSLDKIIIGKRANDILTEYKSVFFTILPELKALDAVEQYRKEQDYDMLTHTFKSVGYSAPVLSVRYALLFHSLGKPDCFSIDKNGVAHYYGFPERSKIIASRIMQRLDLPDNVAREVEFIIKHQTDEFDSQSLAVLQKEIPKELLIKLLQFKYADMRAMSPEFEGAAMKYKRMIELA